MTIQLALDKKPQLIPQKTYIIKLILDDLRKIFSTNHVPALIFTNINRKIKKLTRTSNPFAQRKALEIAHARTISKKIFSSYHPHRLGELLLFSAAGNSIDFFKEIHHSNREMQRSITLSINESKKFKSTLKNAKKILFFADNAGEVFFDLPLVQLLSKNSQVLYVVKSSPVQNDATLTDLKRTCLIRKFPKTIPSGNDAVGIELSTISIKLKKELASCDLIIAKGMGYYETFTELPQFRKKTFHLLMAKCKPVAKSLGVKINSYVFTRK
ncbi:MAG: DUF89 family protein [Candidatus Omnitrophica bacterium]|nr:DUF89 family protein [Candidatus Omnitrophota bacterium]